MPSSNSASAVGSGLFELLQGIDGMEIEEQPLAHRRRNRAGKEIDLFLMVNAP
jgi:hypothetical protein